MNELEERRRKNKREGVEKMEKGKKRGEKTVSIKPEIGTWAKAVRQIWTLTLASPLLVG